MHGSFANDVQTRKSTEGYLLQLFSGPVDWRARKQDTVTTSTTEAELLALSHAAKEIIAWNRIFTEIGLDPEEPANIVDCDNRQIVRLMSMRNPVVKTNLRHVRINNHWLRQEAANRLRQEVQVATEKIEFVLVT